MITAPADSLHRCLSADGCCKLTRFVVSKLLSYNREMNGLASLISYTEVTGSINSVLYNRKKDLA